MTMSNDLQSIADDILARSLKIRPDLEAIEEGKSFLRQATETADQPLVFSSSLGFVKTKRGSKGGEKDGTVAKFDPKAYERLPPKVKQELAKAGVVVVEDKITVARKPSVEVGLAA